VACPSFGADLHVDPEQAVQALRPAHQGAALDGHTIEKQFEEVEFWKWLSRTSISPGGASPPKSLKMDGGFKWRAGLKVASLFGCRERPIRETSMTSRLISAAQLVWRPCA
jgi:hypothetical protein